MFLCYLLTFGYLFCRRSSLAYWTKKKQENMHQLLYVIAIRDEWCNLCQIYCDFYHYHMHQDHFAAPRVFVKFLSTCANHWHYSTAQKHYCARFHLVCWYCQHTLWNFHNTQLKMKRWKHTPPLLPSTVYLWHSMLNFAEWEFYPTGQQHQCTWNSVCVVGSSMASPINMSETETLENMLALKTAAVSRFTTYLCIMTNQFH